MLAQRYNRTCSIVYTVLPSTPIRLYVLKDRRRKLKPYRSLRDAKFSADAATSVVVLRDRFSLEWAGQMEELRWRSEMRWGCDLRSTHAAHLRWKYMDQQTRSKRYWPEVEIDVLITLSQVYTTFYDFIRIRFDVVPLSRDKGEILQRSNVHPKNLPQC